MQWRSAEPDCGLSPGGDPGAVKLREGHGDTVELSRRSPSYRSADADDEILDGAEASADVRELEAADRQDPT